MNKSIEDYRPLVSVIVPIYNVKKYLTKCLESIIDQSYKNLEIVCVDDGSTDGSKEILDSLSLTDQRLKSIRQSNLGLSAARNTGLAESTGEFIYFVDSDDWLHPRAVEKIVEFFLKTDADFITTSFYRTTEEGGENGFYHRYSSDHSYNEDACTNQSISANCCGKAFKSSFINKNRLNFPVGLYYEDVYFHWMAVSYARRIAVIAEPLYYYRIRQDSIMGKTRSKDSDITFHHIYVLKKLYDDWNYNGFYKYHHDLYLEILIKYIDEAFKYVRINDREQFFNVVKDFLDYTQISPPKWTLLYDIKYGKTIINLKYRLRKSIKKRAFLNFFLTPH